MPIVRKICTQALQEIGAYAQGETPSAADLQVVFERLQYQLDSWLAERGTMAVQRRVVYTWPNGQSTQTVGPGGDIDTVRPTWLDSLNYVNPGSSPDQEVPIGLLDPDEYASLNIKALQSGLPLQGFYQTSTDSALGTLFLYPQVTQNVDIVLYFPSGVGIPVTLDDVLIGPPGYNEGFLYQLAERLLSPFAVGDANVIARVMRNAERAYQRLMRPNMQPGVVGMDPALAPAAGGAYNVLSDTYSGFQGR